MYGDEGAPGVEKALPTAPDQCYVVAHCPVGFRVPRMQMGAEKANQAHAGASLVVAAAVADGGGVVE